MSTWLADRGIEDDRWELIVTELVTNAIPFTPSDATVDICFVLADGIVTLDVVDRGPGFDPSVLPVNAVRSERGRGLRLVSALTATMTVDTFDGRTTVQCTNPVPATGAGSSSEESTQVNS